MYLNYHSNFVWTCVRITFCFFGSTSQLVVFRSNKNRNNKHSFAFASLAIFFFTASLSASAQLTPEKPNTEFPYTAIAGPDGALVRCAPGEEFYGTTQLRPGQSVEVWRHDPGGWVAIRPPEDSFSLVRANQAGFHSENVAIVTEANAKSWVGTRLGEVEAPMWQVKLKLDEKLAVLGEIEIEGEIVWLQIAPPAGEFRWVHQSQLEPVPENPQTRAQTRQMRANDIVGSSSPKNQEMGAVQNIRTADFSTTQSDRSPRRQPQTDNDVPENSSKWPVSQVRYQQQASRINKKRNTESVSSESFSSGWKPAKRKMSRLLDKRELETADNYVRTAEKSGDAFKTNWDGLDQATTTTTTTSTDHAVVNANHDLPAKSVVDLELQLSKQVVNDPSIWNLQPLADAAARYSLSITDPGEKAQCEKLIQRIRQFQVTQSKHQVAHHNRTNSKLTNQYTIAATEPQLAGQYDATGFLSELVRDGGLSAPAYVLQDHTGKITHHVTAAPGLNLRRYLKQEIGLIGQRGYNAQLKLDHVNVDRVIVLARHRTVQNQRTVRTQRSVLPQRRVR